MNQGILPLYIQVIFYISMIKNHLRWKHCTGCNRRNVIKLHLLGNKKIRGLLRQSSFCSRSRCCKTKTGWSKAPTPFCFVLSYSISIYFVVSISFFGCSFGIVNLRIPCLNSPLMSASFMSPT